MSGKDPKTPHQIAVWRRQGHGIWKLTFIVEGYDEEFVHLFPGRLSQRFASKLAAHNLSFELKVKKSYIILKSIVKEA